MLLGIIAMLWLFDAWAQNRTITGTVLNEKGSPLVNASVVAKETRRGTTTNNEGHFSLTISSAVKTLVFSTVGYTDQEIVLGITDVLSISLQPAATDMEGVVVTAYGTTQKKAFTGTAATISNEKFKDLQVTTVTGILQGNAAGVLSVNSSGQPGESPTIRIRGIGSFNATNEPLIVVDGSPYSGTINSINPADVETVTVLKDASSTSIYGSRAANGIIQIVTKRGRGKAKFGFSGITGFSQRAVSEYKTVSPSQFMEYTWEALRNDAIANPALLTQFSAANAEDYATKRLVPRLVYNPYNVAQPVGTTGKIDPNAKLLWNDNWIDELTNTGVRTDLNVNVSGGDAGNTIRYYMSGGYIRDQGIVIESDFKRYTGRAKLDAAPVKWFRIGINTSLAYSDQNYPYQGNQGASNSLSFGRTIGPIYPVHLRDWTNGNPILDGGGNRIFDYGNNSPALGVLRPAAQVRPFVQGQNPAGTTSINPITNERLTATGIAYAELDLFKGLNLRSQYSADYNQLDANIFWNPFYGDGTTSGGLSYRAVTLLYAQNFTNTLNFDRTFGEHHINVVGGMESFKQRSEVTSAQRTGFIFSSPIQPSYGTTSSAEGTANAYRLESYFGRVGYDVSDKYHLSLSLRTDGSTRFADSSRWGVFYAAGVAWNLDKEKFMSGIEFLSELKLKASYGTQGNQGLPGSFPYLATYSSGANISAASGAVYNSVANGDLSWETQKQLDLGIEFGILKNRVMGSFVYFHRKSKGLLFSRPLAPSTGANSVNDNTGGAENYGFEIELNTINIKKKDFEWRTSFNITQLKNKITEVAPGTTQVKGQSWYDWFIQEYAGVDKADGLPMWYMDDPASAGKKIITKDYNKATRYHLGNRLSDYTGGMTNFLKYKNFDLAILVSFAIGGKMYDVDYAGLMGAFNSGSLGFNSSTDISSRWQNAANPGDGKTPKLTTATINATAASTRFLYDITYARVRNITLGYRFPEAMLRKVYLGNARLFVDLQNAFTFFDGPKGTDPEAGLNAQTQYNNTTASKTFAIGINIGL
jgi:TonB-linked SusC/RagA family outer membrane protein